MGIIGYKHVKMYETDKNAIKISKSKETHFCNWCGKEIPKGCYLLGSANSKVCLDCSLPFYSKIEEVLNDYLSKLKENKETLKQNYKDYEMNNLSCSI